MIEDVFYLDDSIIAEWEEKGKKLQLFVCSTCGLICDDMIDHYNEVDQQNCILQDWWHLNVKCFVSTNGEHK